MNYTKIIKLGEKLVNELSENEGANTLNKWMAHYIAELIEKADASEGEEKEKYEKECFDTILKLWKHIDKVPNVNTPLRSFSNISEMCDKITTEEKFKYFPEKYKDETSVYLLLAQKVDSLAKEIVRLSFSLAIAEASEDEKEWLEFDMLDDIFSLRNVVLKFEDDVNIGDEIDISKSEKKKLKKSIEEFSDILKLIT